MRALVLVSVLLCAACGKKDEGSMGIVVETPKAPPEPRPVRAWRLDKSTGEVVEMVLVVEVAQ